MGGHRAHRVGDVDVGLAGPERERIVEGDLGRDVAAERVVGRGLVGDDVEVLAAAAQAGSISAALPTSAIDSGSPAAAAARASPSASSGS